jgi:hypothetical protein
MIMSMYAVNTQIPMYPKLYASERYPNHPSIPNLNERTSITLPVVCP